MKARVAWLAVIMVLAAAVITLRVRRPLDHSYRTRIVAERGGARRMTEIVSSTGTVPPVATTIPSSTRMVVPGTNTPASVTPSPPAPTPAREERSAISPQSALENLRVSVRQYGGMYGGNPVGTNLEITRALNGDNPRHVYFLDGARLNDQGELIDDWGTPYFFHQLSGQQTEIRSAGPDKQMWTSDDLVIR